MNPSSSFSSSASSVPFSGGSRFGDRNQDALALDDDIFARFDSKIFRRLWQFVQPYRRNLWLSLLAVAAYALVQVSIPIAIRFVVDAAVADSTDLAHQISLNAAVLIFVGLIALNFVLNWTQEWMAARVAQRVIFDLRRAMFLHLQQVSLSLLDQTQVGRLMSRLQGDVNALQEFMESSISSLGDLFLLVGIVTVLMWMDWQMGLLTLAVLPALVLIRLLWLPWAKQQFRRAREASSAVNSALAENINGIRTVQESQRESLNFDRYRGIAEANRAAQTRSSLASQIMVPSVDILTGIALGVVVMAGGLAVMDGRIAVGVMVAYLFYVQRFFDPIRTLSMQYTVLQRAMAAGYRIFEVLDLPLTLREKENAISLPSTTPAIEFREVTFGYKPATAVLKNINVIIEPGQTIALVGPTGSGKTSVTTLIQRFYDVWQGQVLINGEDVRDLSLASLGKTIGVVLQEPFLFSGSILDNLRYGKPEASDAEIIAAAKAVSAHDFIEKLPDGYHTLLGQRGRNISIGQRQLLSFARTLLVDPKILILDEATANIDSFTEQAIQRALKVLCAGRTSIIIAHRLATIRDADNILVLRAGEVIEQGNHQQLLAIQGLYYQLNITGQSSFEEPVTSLST
ncbi:ABC transporter ATP-binding protein [Cellvibrio polysaccharolyticus]|uniref:ABC transporter ATP-binding protein n=1 Tax=Cellvibrio polysaccharolyticus TaxID=2082724 RepID=A0A928V475_9GAMM|nr:ABC transporter ATP-binding protein [Cellvibrio polysaccharolyticus]MBE8716586.1 ABC transporter ATP-binding protein [Cellvibrio polysaccharolyticus]